MVKAGRSAFLRFADGEEMTLAGPPGSALAVNMAFLREMQGKGYRAWAMTPKDRAEIDGATVAFNPLWVDAAFRQRGGAKPLFVRAALGDLGGLWGFHDEAGREAFTGLFPTGVQPTIRALATIRVLG